MKNSVLPDGKNAIIAYGGKTLSVRKAAGKYLSGMSEFFKVTHMPLNSLNIR
jgi:hypothetical protein